MNSLLIFSRIVSSSSHCVGKEKLLLNISKTAVSCAAKLGTSSFLRSVEEVNPPSNEPPIPAYQEKFDEPLKLKRARLLYQSRKRGMLENGLVLSTFAAKYLNTLEGELLCQYDRLINLPTNDWDIYYWATGVKPTPLEFNNDIMNMLKEHVKNKDRESRIRQPDLSFDSA